MSNTASQVIKLKRKKGYVVFFIALLFFMQMVIPPASALAAEEPHFIVTNFKPSIAVKQGDSFTLTIPIENKTDKTDDDLKVYKASIDFSSFYPTNLDYTPKDIEWKNDKLGYVDFNLTYDGGSRTDIKLIITNSSKPDDVIIVGGDNPIKVKIVTPEEKTPDPTPSTPVDTSKFMPVLQFTGSNTVSGYAGERLGVYLTVKNTSSYSAKDIRIKPILEENSPFIPSNRNFAVIDHLGPDNTATVFFSFDISPYAEEKAYPLKFDFEYYNYSNDFFGGSSSPRSDLIYIKVNNPNTSPQFSVSATSTLANKENLPSEVISTQLKITNLGNLPARDIKVTLQGLKDDGLGLYQDSNLRNISVIDGHDEATLDFLLLPSDKMETGNYGLVARIDYKDQKGEAYTDEFQFFVEVNKGEIKGNQNSVPKIILNQYSSNPSIVKAGENFTLNLSFLNTSPTKTISNIKVYFTVPDGGANSSGNVFSPVNSSNTIYIDSIPPKGIYNKTLEFYTIPDATPKTYTLTANFEYEDEKGESYEAQELIGIPVNQQLRLETSELDIPAEVFLGEPISISVDFYNTGKARLSNLMLKLEGDFETQNASYYVGNFEVGSSDYFEGMVIPHTPGIHEGALVITYEDTSGELMEIRKPFTINAIEMPMPEFPPGFDPEGMPPEGSSKNIWWIGGGTLAAIILVMVLIKKGVFKRLITRKKGLTLDE